MAWSVWGDHQDAHYAATIQHLPAATLHHPVTLAQLLAAIGEIELLAGPDRAYWSCRACGACWPDRPTGPIAHWPYRPHGRYWSYRRQWCYWSDRPDGRCGPDWPYGPQGDPVDWCRGRRWC